MRRTNTPEADQVHGGQDWATEQSEMSAEALLLPEGAKLLAVINKLAIAEKAARVTPLDVILRRRDKIDRIKQRKVFSGSKLLYTYPEITSKEGYSRTVGLTVARTMGEAAYKRAREEAAKLDPPKRDFLEPGQTEYGRRVDNLSLDTSVALDGEGVQPVRFSVTTCSQINPGNPFGARLLQGSFYDIDVFRIDGKSDMSRMFHMRASVVSGSLRNFVSFDESGQPLPADEPSMQEVDMLHQANAEIAADIDLLTGGKPIDINMHTSHLFYSDMFYRSKLPNE